MQQEQFKYSTGVIAYPILFVLFIWVVFWAEFRLGLDIKDFGIYPRTLKGLRGVIFSPILHGDIQHLYNNTIPLFVLSAAVFYFYRRIAWQVIVFGILFSGLLTWIIGRPANHIGASGLIYVLMSFTLFKGIFTRHFRLIALSLIVVFLYGSMLWYVFPIKEQMSWEGHLSGLIVGLLFAFIYRKSIAKPIKYEWEKEDYNEEDDEFLKHFDEDGNFIEHLNEEDSSNGEVEQRPRLKIRYHLRRKKED